MKVKNVVLIIVGVLILIIVGVVGFKIYSNNKENDNLIPNGEAISAPNRESEVAQSEFGRSIDNVTLEVDAGTISKTGTKLIITDTNEIPYDWTPAYKLVVKKDEENWEDVPLLQTVNFDSIKYTFDENKQTVEEIDWTEAYGELESGTYRIAKPLYDNGYIELCSNEFVVE